MFMSSFAAGGSGNGKLIGVGALIVIAIGGLAYSISSYGKGDAIAPVTEADGRATMRKLSCGKCGYEEEVTSAEYNDRMQQRADPTQWLECPKCHENAVQRASSGKPFGSPVAPDASASTETPPPANSEEPVEEAPATPEVRNRVMTPGS